VRHLAAPRRRQVLLGRLLGVQQRRHHHDRPGPETRLSAFSNSAASDGCAASAGVYEAASPKGTLGDFRIVREIGRGGIFDRPGLLIVASSGRGGFGRQRFHQIG
jgi:hypothetical protein